LRDRVTIVPMRLICRHHATAKRVLLLAIVGLGLILPGCSANNSNPSSIFAPPKTKSGPNRSGLVESDSEIEALGNRRITPKPDSSAAPKPQGETTAPEQ